MDKDNIEVGDLVWCDYYEWAEFQVVEIVSGELTGQTLYRLREFFEDVEDEPMMVVAYQEDIQICCKEDEIEGYIDLEYGNIYANITVEIPSGVVVPIIEERTDTMDMKLEELNDYIILYNMFGDEEYRIRIEEVKEELSVLSGKDD